MWYEKARTAQGPSICPMTGGVEIAVSVLQHIIQITLSLENPFLPRNSLYPPRPPANHYHIPFKNARHRDSVGRQSQHHRGGPCARRGTRNHARTGSEGGHQTFGQGQNLAPDQVPASDPRPQLFPPPHCVATTVRIASAPTRAAFTTRRPSARRTSSARGRTRLRAAGTETGQARTGRDRTTVARTWARQARRGIRH